MSERVRVGSCNIANAAAIQALLEAHGIAATTVGGGPYASFAVDIWVDSADAPEASALLSAESDEPEPEPEPEPDPDLDSSDSMSLHIQRKRHTGVAILLAFCIGFGTAHLFARAYLRGLLLGALEIYGISLVVHGRRVGIALIVAAIVTDAIGSVVRIRARSAPAPLPRARARR